MHRLIFVYPKNKHVDGGQPEFEDNMDYYEDIFQKS